MNPTQPRSSSVGHPGLVYNDSEVINAMDESDFEGTLVLEKLAAVGALDGFYEAVDADDFNRATKLMRRAGIDPKTIAVVLKKMSASED